MVGHLDPAGLSCLSDDQILPILIHMDTDTLLNVSRSFMSFDPKQYQRIHQVNSYVEQ